MGNPLLDALLALMRRQQGGIVVPARAGPLEAPRRRFDFAGEHPLPIRVAEEWRVFWMGALLHDGDLMPPYGRVLDWDAAGQLYATWMDWTTVQEQMMWSGDDGETWTSVQGSSYNTPWGGGLTYSSWYPGIGTSSGGVALGSYFGLYDHCGTYYDDVLGYQTSVLGRYLHRALVSRDAQFSNRHWSLRRFYDGGAGYSVDGFAARTHGHTRYGILIYERNSSAGVFRLGYHDLDASGNFEGYAIGQSPPLEVVFQPATAVIGRFALVFFDEEPTALWYEGTTLYKKHRTASGWPSQKTAVAAGEIENYFCDYSITLKQSEYALTAGGQLFGATILSADNPNEDEFILRDLRGPGPWSGAETVALRETKNPPSTAEVDAPRAWVTYEEDQQVGLHAAWTRWYGWQSVAPWLKQNRYLFMILPTYHNHDTHVSGGANPTYDGEAYRDNPIISDDIYAREQQWMVRLDLGA